MTRHSAFAPLVDADTRALILGSLPGEASLAAAQYYAHPRNLFWHLTGMAIGRELRSLDYIQRIAALSAAGVGLWDTLASAQRQGSLDAAIRDGEAADLVRLAGELPNLRAIAFNGRKAAEIGRRQLAGTPLALIDLPSSSPAYAALPLAEKERRWAGLREFLGDALPIPRPVRMEDA
ncbi:MAG TPA: DNA-deoxyinosine glycosylase [Qipengyuania sp.]|nr:DNA-deoxyinosine glycosylase [Qipengyuania sp.]